jgi:integral membrane protein (TIGR01906 family)
VRLKYTRRSDYNIGVLFLHRISYNQNKTLSMKIIKIIALIIFVLCLPLMLFTVSVSAAANCPWLYTYDFSKYDISQKTGIDKAELDKIPSQIISYWNNSDETLNITVIKDGRPFTLFNEKEITHMVDVKGLFRLAYRALLITFLYALIFTGLALFLWKDRKLLAAGLMWGSGLTLLLMVFVAVASAIDFNWLFGQFHALSFTNDLWQLNPYTDYLLMMFPEGFWLDAVMMIAGLITLLALALGFTGWRIRKKRAA